MTGNTLFLYALLALAVILTASLLFAQQELPQPFVQDRPISAARLNEIREIDVDIGVRSVLGGLSRRYHVRGQSCRDRKRNDNPLPALLSLIHGSYSLCLFVQPHVS